MSDAASIASIYNGYVTDTTVSFECRPVSEEEMLMRISDISAVFPYFVYDMGGEVVGYCYAHWWKARAAYRHTLETTVYVSENFIGQGIGKALMSELIAECRIRGYHSLIACITADNLHSIMMHERLGFRLVSRFKQVGFKFGRWLDVVDYELLLD